MRNKMVKLFLLASVAALSAFMFFSLARNAEPSASARIPKTWDEAALADWATPLAGLNERPTHISANLGWH